MLLAIRDHPLTMGVNEMKLLGTLTLTVSTFTLTHARTNLVTTGRFTRFNVFGTTAIVSRPAFVTLASSTVTLTVSTAEFVVLPRATHVIAMAVFSLNHSIALFVTNTLAADALSPAATNLQRTRSFTLFFELFVVIS